MSWNQININQHKSTISTFCNHSCNWSRQSFCSSVRFWGSSRSWLRSTCASNQSVVISKSASIVVLDFDLSFLCLFGYSVILFGFHVQIEIQRRTRSLFPPGTAPPWVRKCRRAGRWSHRWSRWALRTKSPAPRKRMKKVSVIVSMLEFWFWHVELELVRRRPEITIHYENVWNIFKTF